MKKTFDIQGMTCAACSANIERRVNKLSGVKKAQVSLMTNSMNVDFDDKLIKTSDIISAVDKIGYQAFLQDQKTNNTINLVIDMEENLKKRFIKSLIFLIFLMYISMGHMAGLPLPYFLAGTKGALAFAFTQFLLTLPIIFINREFFISGFKALKNGGSNMDTLVSLGAGASLIYGIFAIYMMAYAMGALNFSIVDEYRKNLYFESSAMILTLITLGKYFEEKSKNKTKNSLKSLMDLAPKMANVIVGDKIIKKKAEDIKIDDIILVKPGEQVPCDGLIVEGGSYLNQAALTGESLPVYKKIGDEVISATVNDSSSFKFKATKVGEDTTFSKIIAMVSGANQSKAPIAKTADKISRIFVPTVIAISLITFTVWILLTRQVETALNFAISVLVISCPCALGLATPVSIMIATGIGAKEGLLFKNAEVLENLHKVDAIVLDKTGTITKGEAQVTDLVTNIDDEEFVSIIIGLEKYSEHPLAKSILSLKNKYKIKNLSISDFKSITGKGVQGKIKDKIYLAGNLSLIEDKNINNTYKEKATSLQKAGKTLIYLADDKEVLGLVALIDPPKENSDQAIKNLKAMGYKTVMLTGDNINTALAIQKTLGIDQVHGGLLPQDKNKIISSLQKEGKKVLMVGDGINDAPSLATADIGMAIGSGTDVAIETSDVVLMTEDLRDISSAIEISKKTIKNIKENLFWAFFYNSLGIPLAAGIFYPGFGIKLNPMIGAAAMSFSSVFVVTNALRLRKIKINKHSKYKKENIDSSEVNIINSKGENKMEKILKINGMSCDHCVAHVKKALEQVDGVKSAEVSLENKQAKVYLSKEVEEKAFKKAIEDAGYELSE